MRYDCFNLTFPELFVSREWLTFSGPEPDEARDIRHDGANVGWFEWAFRNDALVKKQNIKRLVGG